MAQAQTPPAHRPPALGTYPRLATLMIIAAVSPLAINMFVPSIPNLVVALDTTYARAQLGLSLFLAASAILQLLVGPLSDRFGRRIVLQVTDAKTDETRRRRIAKP